MSVKYKTFLPIKGSRPYPSDNAKRQIDVISGWVGLKRSPLTLCCNNMYITLDIIIGGWVGQKNNVNLTFCVVTWVWTAPLK